MSCKQWRSYQRHQHARRLASSPRAGVAVTDGRRTIDGTEVGPSCRSCEWYDRVGFLGFMVCRNTVLQGDHGSGGGQGALLYKDKPQPATRQIRAVCSAQISWHLQAFLFSPVRRESGINFSHPRLKAAASPGACGRPLARRRLAGWSAYGRPLRSEPGKLLQLVPEVDGNGGDLEVVRRP
jgi:hypothetical protein